LKGNKMLCQKWVRWIRKKNEFGAVCMKTKKELDKIVSLMYIIKHEIEMVR